MATHTHPPLAPSSRALSIVLAVLSSLAILVFFFAAFARFRYPLQLEWLECGVLDAVGRLLAHQQIYVRPSPDFIPYIYTPLYYHVAAAAAKLFGLHFATLRLVSIAATTGCFALLYALTRRLASSPFAGLLAAGLFAALYAASNSWYDLARVDMLFVFLALLAIVASYRGYALAAGLLFALAYQTKQGAFLIAICVLLHEFRDRRKLLTGVGAFLIATAGSVFLLNRASGGWYAYYTEFLPRHHALFPKGAFIFFAKDLLFRLLPAIVLIAAWGWRALRGHAMPVRDRRFLIAATLGTFLSAFAGRIHSGGSINVTLPLYAWITVLFGTAVERGRTWNFNSASRNLLRMPCTVLGLAVLQFALLVYWPGKLIPSRQAYAHANAVLDRLAATPGDLYVFDNAADLLERGHPSFANSDAIFDVLRADRGPIAAQLKADLDAAFRTHRFAGIISDRPLSADFPYTGAPASLLSGYVIDAPPAFPFAADTRAIEPPHVAPLYLFPAGKDGVGQPSTLMTH